jgi:catechol 2,3-dioxygenase-like lactoylglutathione lyase family enzyme
MSVRILEIHHHAFRVGSGKEVLERTVKFYEGVLGLEVDTGRPFIRDAPGAWMDVATCGQIHLIALSGESNLAQGAGRDPTAPHIAFGVEDICKARDELDSLGVSYWTINVMSNDVDKTQLFFNDPSGNLLELHQIGTCRCISAERVARSTSL